MGHPEPLNIVIIEKFRKLMRIYGTGKNTHFHVGKINTGEKAHLHILLISFR